MKRALVIVLALSMVVFAAACGDESATSDEVADDGPVVELTLDVVQSGETLKYSGTTNLPDGAVLTALIEYADDDDGMESILVVHDGRFEDELGAIGGPVEVRVVFQMHVSSGGWPGQRQQPPGLTERFGENGEKMEGDTVVDYSDGVTSGRRAEIVATGE